MLDEHGALLPHGWVTGDDEMGRPMSFRLELRTRGERYLLAIPSNTLVRDGDAAAPEYSGRGRHPKNPFLRVDRWCAAQPESAWTTIEVRDGEKGPLRVDTLKCRVQARTPTGGTGLEEVLFITREHQSDGIFKHNYYLSNADPTVPLEEFSRVAKAEHRVEECLERAKGEAGLGLKQARCWAGILSQRLLARVRTTIGGPCGPNSTRSDSRHRHPLICLLAQDAVVDRDIQIPASSAARLSTAMHERPAGTLPATRSTTTTGRSTDAHPSRSGKASG